MYLEIKATAFSFTRDNGKSASHLNDYDQAEPGRLQISNKKINLASQPEDSFGK
jgi:hypothetical protein